MVGVKSAREFREKVGVLRLLISGVGVAKGELTAEQKVYIAERVLEKIEGEVEENEVTYVGTEEFVPVAMSEVFKDGIRRKYYVREERLDQEFGEPQSTAKDPKYRLELAEKKWYAYTENYGTSEEKLLVKMLDGVMEELGQKWEEIYLLKNEKAFVLYDFAGGREFAPDFVLVAKDKQQVEKGWQVFLEPKDGQLLLADKWKEDFLLEIERKGSVEVLAEDEGVRVLGLPFDNEEAVRELRRLS